jgi:hypothetical protein
MAITVKKLANLGSSTSLSYLMSKNQKAYIQALRALSPWGGSIRRDLSVGAGQTGSSASSDTSGASFELMEVEVVCSSTVCENVCESRRSYRTIHGIQYYVIHA